MLLKSFGAHAVSAMATEIKQKWLGQVDRLTLLDPGTMVSDSEVDGNPNKQQGLIHKVKIYFDRIEYLKSCINNTGLPVFL